MELPKFKLTKKAIVILTAVVIVLLVVITSCSNQASLRKKEREIDREVSDQEQKITETIRLCEEMLSLADEALDELDTLTVAVCERDDFFKNKAQLPATLLLEDPSAMDGYYIQYVNDYVMEKPLKIIASGWPCFMTNIKYFNKALTREDAIKESLKYTTSEPTCVFNDVARRLDSGLGYAVR